MCQLTLFAEDSPAKTLASQEKEQDLQESVADCGLNSTDLLKNSSRRMSLQKTLQPFVLEDWIKCLGHSMRSGMMRNGIVYPLQPLAPLTVETEYGLWPTPTLQDTPHKKMVLTSTGRRLSKNGKSSHSLNLADKVGGQLNPQWVEWLMGFPIGHTDVNS